MLLLVPVLVAGACAKASGPADGSATEPPASPVASVVGLDTTGRAVSATHVPTGRTHVLFEDETVEDSEEGTFHRLLSRFGPYVSYSVEWYYEGGAHPSYGKAYHAVTVSAALEDADLRTLFSEDALYEAMQQTPLVRETPLEHASLDELLDGLAATYACEMSFDGFYSSFFVKTVRAGVAEVIVGLTHGCEVARGAFTTFTLMLDVPDDKKELFADLQVF
jgi:hypothetical protein